MLWSRRLSCISQLTADRARRRSEGPNGGGLDCYEIAWTTSWLASRADADALQVIVAERAIGVEALEQVSRVGELGIRGV
jgi:hypothetical protein